MSYKIIHKNAEGMANALTDIIGDVENSTKIKK